MSDPATPETVSSDTNTSPGVAQKRQREGKTDAELRQLVGKVQEKKAEWRGKADIANAVANERDAYIAEVREEMLRRGVRRVFFADGSQVSFKKRKAAAPVKEEILNGLKAAGFSSEQIIKIRHVYKYTERYFDDLEIYIDV